MSTWHLPLTFQTTSCNMIMFPLFLSIFIMSNYRCVCLNPISMSILPQEWGQDNPRQSQNQNQGRGWGLSQHQMRQLLSQLFVQVWNFSILTIALVLQFHFYLHEQNNATPQSHLQQKSTRLYSMLLNSSSVYDSSKKQSPCL